VALEDTVIYRVHSFQDVWLKILLAALAANTGGDIAHDHQMFLTPIVVIDSLLDYFSAAIRTIRVMVHDRPPLVLGSVHFGAVGV
jgi:hypothetical protein